MMTSTHSQFGNFRLGELVESIDAQMCFHAAHQKLGRQCLVTLTRSTPSRNAEAAQRYIAIAREFQSRSFHAFPKAYTAGLQDGAAFLTTEFVKGTALDRFWLDVEECGPSQAFQVLGQLLVCGLEIEKLGFSTDNIRFDDFVVDQGVLKLWRIHELRLANGNVRSFMPLVQWDRLVDHACCRAAENSRYRKRNTDGWTRSISKGNRRSIEKAVRWLARASESTAGFLAERNDTQVLDESTQFAIKGSSSAYLRSKVSKEGKLFRKRPMLMGIIAAVLLFLLSLSLWKPNNAKELPTLIEPIRRGEPFAQDMINLVKRIDPRRDTFGLAWNHTGAEATVAVEHLSGLTQIPVGPTESCTLIAEVRFDAGSFEIGFSAGQQRLMATIESRNDRYRLSLWSLDALGQQRILDESSIARVGDHSSVRIHLATSPSKVKLAISDGDGPENRAVLDFWPTRIERLSLGNLDSFYECPLFLKLSFGNYVIEKLELTTDEHPSSLFDEGNSQRALAQRAIWRGGEVTIRLDELESISCRTIDSVPDSPFITGLSARSDNRPCGLNDRDMDWIGSIKDLQVLDLEGTQMTELAMARLHELKELQSLYVDGRIDGTTKIAAIRPGENLRALSLRKFQLTGADAACFRSLDQLTYLCLSGCMVDGTIGQELMPYLPSLEHLCFVRSTFPPSGLAAISKWTSLRELQLSGTQVSDNDLTTLAAFESLTMVDLESTNVTQSGIDWLRAKAPGIEIRY